MRTEKLLDAIGEIDDQLIEDAAPKKKSKIVKINWIKYGSIAACLLLFAVLIYGVSTIRMGSMEEAASDAAAPEETIMEDAAVMEETAAEEEAPAMEDVPASEEAPAPEEPSEGMPTDEFPAEEAPAEDTSETEIRENINDVAYGIVVNGNLYFPISFQERKDFHLIDENAAGLTPENTYQITEKDLGEIIGVVTSSAEESNIGLTLYHYAEYPGDNSIGILDRNGTYEFYVLDREYSE